ncbi:hypothetical protein B0H10DRAFT_2054829 [Mycena sp. CBHHK59/15]|nr:hypothetical protein B0H10DRAFT_2054829 [Mycena sp. CBHHK59/15]
MSPAVLHGDAARITQFLAEPDTDVNAPRVRVLRPYGTTAVPVQRVLGDAGRRGWGMRGARARAACDAWRGCKHGGGTRWRAHGAASGRGGRVHDIVQLLHAGVSVNAPDVDVPGCYCHGYTAMSAAAERGGVKVMRRLLEVEADVRAVSGDTQRTALNSTILFTLYSTYK